MPEIRAKEIVMVPIADLRPNPKNRNRHSDEQIEQLAKIIEYQGFRIPLVVSNRSGLLIAGHGRLMAAKKAGMNVVPVIYQDFENESAEYAAQVSDNAIASWAELDLSGIHTDLPDLAPFDLDLLGIKNFQLEPSETDIEIGEPGIGSEPDVSQCPNCGHILK